MKPERTTLEQWSERQLNNLYNHESGAKPAPFVDASNVASLKRGVKRLESASRNWSDVEKQADLERVMGIVSSRLDKAYTECPGYAALNANLILNSLPNSQKAAILLFRNGAEQSNGGNVVYMKPRENEAAPSASGAMA